jgi:type IV pilus assembly protein PilM
VRSLPAGAVTPTLSGTNIHQPELLRKSLAETLSAVGGTRRTCDVVAVLPDAAIRVLLLDFETLPDNDEEAAAIIRFRLKKSLPFDVEHSSLSFDRVRINGTLRAIVALSPAPVIAEYEQAFRDAGYEPGVVIPSVIGSLGLVDVDRPAMLVKVDRETTSIALADSSGLSLMRTLEHPSGMASPSELLNAVHASLIFYEDSMGQPVSRVLLTGAAADANTLAALRSELSVTIGELATTSGEGRVLAAVEGALLA